MRLIAGREGKVMVNGERMCKWTESGGETEGGGREVEVGRY